MNHRYPAVGAPNGRRLTLGGLAVVLAVAVASCAPQSPPQPDQQQPLKPTVAADATVGTTAVESKAAFDQAAQRVTSATSTPTTAAFIDELALTGFDPSSIETGSDTTTEGKPADALFWSVEFPDGCLIGQYRNVQPDPEDQDPVKLLPYTSMIAPATARGCLLGGDADAGT